MPSVPPDPVPSDSVPSDPGPSDPGPAPEPTGDAGADALPVAPRRGRRTAVRGVQGAVLVALVGGTALYASGSTTVQLDVDGVGQQVRLFNGDVSDVLAEAAVEVGPHDVVAPAAGTELEDGDTVVVARARQLELTVDGQTSTHWTTARTVEEALADLDVRAGGAVLSASRSQPLGRGGGAVQVTTPKAVTVLVDGRALPTTSTAASVADLLAELDVVVGERDAVSVAPTSLLTDGLVVAVTRVADGQAQEEEAVPAGSTERESDDLFVGETEVETEGVPGVLTRTFAQTTADGRLVHRKLVSEEVTTAPVAEVVLVGTRERPAPEPEPEPEPVSAPEPARTSAPSSSDDEDDAPSSSSSGSSSGSSSSGSSSSGSSGSSDDEPEPEPTREPEPEPEPSTPPAPAVSNGSTWDRLAECESGGNWSISTGNGYYGGLQFDRQTWQAYGGTGVASDHSREQQIAIATKVRDDRGGYGAWPSCSRKLGL